VTVSVTLEKPGWGSNTIKAWPAAEAHVNAPGGANEPKVAAKAEASASANKVTLTGLIAGEKYVIGATISSVFEYETYVAPPETPSSEEKTRAQEAELAIENPPLFGGLTQIGNTLRPARSNWQGSVALTDGALAASGVAAFVPISAQIGDVFTKLAIVVGGTAASTPTHQWGALYIGGETEAKSTLIQQTTDATTTARAEKVVAAYTFSPAVTITEAMVPYKYVYAAISMTGTTIVTAATFAEQLPAGVRYRWNFGSQFSPVFESFTAGTALGATAGANIETAAHKAVCPVIVLY
jgi:hypothetical protein